MAHGGATWLMCSRTNAPVGSDAVATGGGRDSRAMTGGDHVNPPAIIRERDRLYAGAMKLIEGEIVLDGVRRPLALNWWTGWRLRRAIRLLRKVLEINPYSWPSWFAIGKAYERLGAIEAAMEAFKRAVEIVPTNGSMAKEACAQAMALGYYDWAVRFAELALHSRPDDPAAHSNMGVLLIITERPVDAQRAFQRALELEPHSASSTRLLALTKRVIAGDLKCPTSVKEVQQNV